MIIVLDNIRSLYNVGSIFRTADALGVEKTVAWEYNKSTTNALCDLKKQKYKIFAVELDKRSIPYFKVKIKKSDLAKIAIVFGNEVNGISKNILKKADKILEIPMAGKKESLNV